MTLELNEQEAQVLINLIDMAVGVGKLQVAESATYFFKKIKEGFEKNKNEESKKE